MPAVPHIGVPDGMTESPLHHDHRLLASEFFPRARERLTFDVRVLELSINDFLHERQAKTNR